MLFGVYKDTSYDRPHQFLDKIDGIELRLDLFPEIDSKKLRRFRKSWNKKILLTLRTQGQGGKFAGTVEEQQKLWKELCALHPDFIDLEYDAPKSLYEYIKQNYPTIQIIASYHDFAKTPKSIETIFADIQGAPADIYKIVTYAQNSVDSLKMLLWVQQASRANKKVIGLCMGEEGRLTRILSPVVGNFLNYASFEKEAIAPGQLSTEELFNLYQYEALSRDTKVFAVIGYPVARSLGPITHNAVMQKLLRQAVYLKIPLKKEDLKDFFYYVENLKIFAGLSVTMPLKEEVLSYLDDIDPEAKAMGAVNTIVYKGASSLGYNTDGGGAARALEEKIELFHKKVIIIGAGGVAKAIAYRALQKKAHVYILNRTEEKALHLARVFCCGGGPLSRLASLYREGYDVLINATPDDMPIEVSDILPGCIAMDVKTRPPLTQFLRKAQERGCRIVYGYEMFMHQAGEQQKLWFGREDQKSLVSEIITESTLVQVEPLLTLSAL